MTSTSLRDLANVPHPAGVTFVDDWVDVECGDPHRYFRGSFPGPLNATTATKTSVF
jgi:hypothetical protein